MPPIEHIPVEVFDTPQAMAGATADDIVDYINGTDHPVLGLATGSTPIIVYRRLVELHRQGRVSFENVVTFNLDEYYGLPKKDARSYHAFMWRHLFGDVNINPSNVHIPDGMVARTDVDEFCEEYERRITQAGGIGLQLLGIGKNGHIGFNEPCTAKELGTHFQALADTTRISAAGDFFGEQNVPTHAITMGIRSILEADRIILLAQGEGKSPIVLRTIEGDENGIALPANHLRDHPNAVVRADAAAATRLTRMRAPWVVEEMPDWQEKVQRRKAVFWLAHTVEKTIAELEEHDFMKHNLASLLTSSDLATLQSEASEFLNATITIDPGDLYFRITGTDRDSIGPLNVMSLCPHPDDTEISMGGTALRHTKMGDTVTVTMQTSGNIAVPDGKTISFIRDTMGGEGDELVTLIENKNPGEPDDARILEIKTRMRLLECKQGCQGLGISGHNVTGLQLPFYETGLIEKSDFTEMDVARVVEKLQQEKPHMIYAANDLTDPHGTHRVCMNILLQALDQLRDEEWLRHSVLALYRGAWQEYELFETDMTVAFTAAEVDAKQQAIKAHDTQEPALFPGEDRRAFYARAFDRNAGTAHLCTALGAQQEVVAAESFVGVSLADFVARGKEALPKDLQGMLDA